jgi:hypothetical protein
MKSMNIMAVAAVLALTSASVASAQTVIRVTGSTAFRAAVVSAEVAVAGGTAKGVWYPTSAAATKISNAQYSVVFGTTYTFENNWTGSIAGFEAVTDGAAKVNFPTGSDVSSPVACTAASLTSGSAAGGGSQSAITSSSSVPFDSNQAADIALSDVAADLASTVSALGDPVVNTPTEVTAGGTIGIGIVPFVFVFNASSDVLASHTFTNGQFSMDPQKFTYFYGTSNLPVKYKNGAYSSGGPVGTLSFFTSANADRGITVYPMGRDIDSGTRASALAETGYTLNGSGFVAANGLLKQYFPYNAVASATTGNTSAYANGSYGNGSGSGCIGNDSSATGAIAAFQETPAVTYDSYSMLLGNSGYYAGGNLAQAVSTQSTVTSSAEVAYLGVSDSNKALTNTAGASPGIAAYLMSYNGATFDPRSAAYSYTPPGSSTPITGPSLSNPNQEKIYEGTYTYWSYEHLFITSAGSNVSNATSAASSLVSSLYGNGTTTGLDVIASNGVTLGLMNVSRSDDGQNVQ